MPRYRFQDFVLSPQRRTLLRDGRELPLIPRYFDLLVFLVERRNQAVHRRDIFDHVWHDVVVSDSALSQAIRTIRRVLDDDSREPRFVRTVSRHGYRFVFDGVIEEEEEEIAVGVAWPGSTATQTPVEPTAKIVLPGLERPLWMNAAIGGGCAGLIAGGVGALLLALVPDARASLAVVPVLSLLGGVCGAAGAAGIGAGISAATWVEPPLRRVTAVVGAALGGGIVGLAAQLLGRWTLQTLGLDVAVGGLVQGVTIGAACGLAHEFVGRSSELPLRTRVATFALLSGLAALVLVLAGQPLVGATLHALSHASAGAQTTLAPLGHLLGEQDFGPMTAAIVGTGEGVLFGAGLGLGLNRSR